MHTRLRAVLCCNDSFCRTSKISKNNVPQFIVKPTAVDMSNEVESLFNVTAKKLGAGKLQTERKAEFEDELGTQCFSFASSSVAGGAMSWSFGRVCRRRAVLYRQAWLRIQPADHHTT
jgi:hypothetical protein